MINSTDDVFYVAAVNDDEVLERNLYRSPCIHPGINLLEMRGFSSASTAYNKGMDKKGAKIYVFVHQDVYLPASWSKNLSRAIAELEQRDPDWAVLGVAGIDNFGAFVGRVWSTGLQVELGSDRDLPARVRSVDELLIVIRTHPGLRFDQNLPGFHLYGTDIVQTAHSLGLGAHVVHAPVIHNSRPVRSLLGAYEDAYRYMADKWASALPIVTPCAVLAARPYSIYRTELSLRKRWLVKQLLIRFGKNRECIDPVKLSKQLEYE
ncbi:glycosyltransferase [Qipengyuania citrea]|uniref:glycosyltransferase n=1 Tax=Qipengyuania citrea TaxID=225971 RepID=UPI000B0092EA|nr:glycosyltransferase [Qipengyuania citrea]